MGKDGKRSDNENYRKNYSAVTINHLGLLFSVIVIEDCRDQNFDQGKENQQCADEEEKIESRHVRQTRQLAINGETIGNQGKHRGDRDADLRVRGGRIDPKNGPGHHYDQNEG